MGFCLYGNDINDTTSPIEAGLGWITKFTKDFINKDYIEGHKKNGTSKKLVGLELLDKAIARQHTEIVNEAGEVIGEVTSGTLTPSVNKSIAMGYVPTELSKVGSTVLLKIRNKTFEAKVVSFPFYQPSK
jgi:aminomethyltransferase